MVQKRRRLDRKKTFTNDSHGRNQKGSKDQDLEKKEKRNRFLTDRKEE